MSEQETAAPANGQPEAFHQFNSGAVRGTDLAAVRYDLLPWVGLRRVAETCAYGAGKYGVHNWRKGIPSADLLNHALAHVANYLDGDRSEDHLAHAAWNLMAAMDNEERRPEMQGGLLRPGGVSVGEVIDRLEIETL